MTRTVLPLLAACLAGCLAPAPASAQETPARDPAANPPATAATPVVAPPATRPDIEFAASVQMESIRFTGPQKAAVTITGGPAVLRHHEVDRGGLPLPLPIGRTYRDITVHTTIAATLLDPSIDADAQLQVGTPASPPNDTPEDRP